MRKSISLLLVLILGSILLAGCGGRPGSESEPKEPTIIGTWRDGFGWEYTYTEDGKIVFPGGEATVYAFEDGILTQYGDSFITIFEVVFEDYNTMVLTQTDPYPLEPYKYTRKK